MNNDQKPFPRKAVLEFALKMEEILQNNDEKGGWDKCNQIHLANKLVEECVELLLVMKNIGKPGAIRVLAGAVFTLTNAHDYRDEDTSVAHEAADVANIAMMIWDNWGRDG